MSLNYGNIHFSQQPEKVVLVSGSLMRSLGLSGKKTSCFGSARARLRQL